MANMCYTKYKIEGPKEQMNKLIHYINSVLMQDHPSKKDEDYRYLKTYCNLHKITREEVAALNNDGLLLSLETRTKWGPENHTWVDIIRYYVPKADIFYYAEEFWAGKCMTNDVWGKYFHGTYAVYVDEGENMFPKVKKIFCEDAEYRCREDQVGWFSYLSMRELGWRMSQFVPSHRMYFHEILAEFEDLVENEYWKGRPIIAIRPIERVVDKLLYNPYEKHCHFCQDILPLEEKLRKLEQENEHLKERLAAYEHGKHSPEDDDSCYYAMQD